ncbi:hypothetical protein LZ554_007109 [Drepanopeziza brunnea f. sp. 'monogermtubi']|nr:hypothetical protein LZ554_007109 [Drepanopeziza brunnea f. sp. 'monogermtubi']
MANPPKAQQQLVPTPAAASTLLARLLQHHHPTAQPPIPIRTLYPFLNPRWAPHRIIATLESLLLTAHSSSPAACTSTMLYQWAAWERDPATPAMAPGELLACVVQGTRVAGVYFGKRGELERRMGRGGEGNAERVGGGGLGVDVDVDVDLDMDRVRLAEEAVLALEGLRRVMVERYPEAERGLWG